MALVNVDVDLLRTLLVVAEVRSFTAAGEALCRTQSAISLQIKRLEQVVGEKILDRGSGKSIELTKTGEIVQAYAQQILKLNDALVAEVKTSSAVRKLRIGLPDDYAELLLPKIICEMSKQNEMIEMQIISDLSTRLGDLVDNQQLDVAFMTRDEGVTGFGLLNEKLSWVSAKDARVVNETPLPLALFPEGCGVRRNALAALDAVGRRWRIAYCSPSFSTLRTAILEKQAIGVLPARAIPMSMIELGPDEGLPELKSSELLVRVAPQASAELIRITSQLLRAFEVDLNPSPVKRP